MPSLSINSLWTFLQSLSLTASNEKWLAERLYESAAAKSTAENIEKQKALESIFGSWDEDSDAKVMEQAISESRNCSK